MDRNELRKLLNNLPNERHMSKLVDEVARAQRVAGIDGWLDFIEMEILKHHEVIPKLSVVPPKKRLLLDLFFDEAYEYALQGAFKHRDDPDMFMAYCSPFSDKRGRYLDEMTSGQRTVIAMMNEDIMAHKKRNRQRAEKQDTIDDALDNAIKERMRDRETGGDSS